MSALKPTHTAARGPARKDHPRSSRSTACGSRPPREDVDPAAVDSFDCFHRLAAVIQPRFSVAFAAPRPGARLLTFIDLTQVSIRWSK